MPVGQVWRLINHLFLTSGTIFIKAALEGLIRRLGCIKSRLVGAQCGFTITQMGEKFNGDLAFGHRRHSTNFQLVFYSANACQFDVELYRIIKLSKQERL